MSRRFLTITRVSDQGAGDEKESADKLSPWLKSFADNIGNKPEPTAVDLSRKRAQSIVSTINVLMANPPRYATVEDAVEDMRDRTGLNEYIRKVTSSSKKKTLNKSAKDLVSLINETMSDDNSDKELDNDAEDIPDVLKKYPQDAQDNIISFIKNNINDAHGLYVTIPQLQYDILHLFGYKYGLSSHEIEDPDFIRFLSKMLEGAERTVVPEAANSDIGSGLANQSLDDNDNNNYFGFADKA